MTVTFVCMSPTLNTASPYGVQTISLVLCRQPLRDYFPPMKMRPIVLMLVHLYIRSILAQPGTLDPNFCIGGICQPQIGSGSSVVYDVITSPDTSIFICGGSTYAGAAWAFVGKLQPDGAVDTNFGASSGFTLIDVGTETVANALSQAADGSMYVSGTSWFGAWSTSGIIAHMLQDGSMDPDFGVDGVVIVDHAGLPTSLSDIVIQPDGMILVCGSYEVAGSSNSLLVRIQPDGVVDTTFSGNGYLPIDAYPAHEELQGVGMMADGSIIATGFALVGSWAKSVLLKCSSTGILEPSFGTGGIFELALPTYSSYGYDVAVTSQGIYVAGVSGYSGLGEDTFLARVHVDGSMDTGFASAGSASLDLAPMDRAYCVQIQDDMKVLIFGTTGQSGLNPSNILVLRYDTSGILDPTFGMNGIVSTTVLNEANYGLAGAIQPDGKIVCAGFGSSGLSDNFAAVVRYLNELSVHSPAMADASSIMPYPNPLAVGGVMNLHSSCSVPPTCFNSLGQHLVLDIQRTTKDQWSIRTDGLAAGCYFVSVAAKCFPFIVE
jgi:uncharacterized delta-60 repeat protein